VIQRLSGREKRVRLEVGRRTSELAYELRKSKSIVENAAIAILLLGADGTVLFANSASEPLLAVSIPEILNRKIGSVLQDEFIESYLEVSEAGQAVSAEKQIQVKLHSGSLRWFEVRMSSFESETGNPTVTVILKDVTDAVEAHYNLEASERRWNMALEGSQIGVFDMDLAKGKASASDAWRRLAGFTISAEVDIQAEWEARVHPEDLVKVKQADQECLDGKVDSVFVEYRLKRLDGVWRWMRGSARVVDRDAQGRPLRFLGTMMDITELRNAIDKARTEEDNLSAQIETAPVGMAVLGLDGSFLMANNAFCQFTGYSKDILRAIAFGFSRPSSH